MSSAKRKIRDYQPDEHRNPAAFHETREQSDHRSNISNESRDGPPPAVLTSQQIYQPSYQTCNYHQRTSRQIVPQTPPLYSKPSSFVPIHHNGQFTSPIERPYYSPPPRKWSRVGTSPQHRTGKSDSQEHSPYYHYPNEPRIPPFPHYPDYNKNDGRPAHTNYDMNRYSYHHPYSMRKSTSADSYTHPEVRAAFTPPPFPSQGKREDNMTKIIYPSNQTQSPIYPDASHSHFVTSKSCPRTYFSKSFEQRDDQYLLSNHDSIRPIVSESYDDESLKSCETSRASYQENCSSRILPQRFYQEYPNDVRSLPSYSESRGRSSSSGSTDPQQVTLLALPGDRKILSESLCIVRENIEIFTTTEADLEEPAPGRKNPVIVGQVGIRCIHCKHQKDRVKRASCYPSSLQRIYRTVTDMKLDHFDACPYVPMSVKSKLNELKTTASRSNGTTMQYFIESAKSLGMTDSSQGIRLSLIHTPSFQFPDSMDRLDRSEHLVPRYSSGQSSSSSYKVVKSEKEDQSLKTIDTYESLEEKSSSVYQAEYFTGCIPIALKEDELYLSPLRCFLRENVVAFSATEEDLQVRTATCFSVAKGQVGIACKYCYSLPSTDRQNRAVCFPSSCTRIYQSVADMQRFHFGDCKHVPQDTRTKFEELQSASSKGSKGLATRQYWINAAKKIGLVDTDKGIRFARDPNKPSAPAFSLNLLAQVASIAITHKPLVLEEDRPLIAEFLYLVMQQLQPCRFTEADRNKRRLKNLGCRGVECKHCAGQVHSRKFFWSSVNAVESNFVSVHTHMLQCRHVPEELKEKLVAAKALRKEHTSKLKTGSQKAFFAKVWERLHSDEK